jgi:hypothetical protein
VRLLQLVLTDRWAALGLVMLVLGASLIVAAFVTWPIP